MLRDRGAAGGKILGDLADGLPAGAQQAQDLAAGRIGDRPEDRVTLLPSYRNHLVTGIVTEWLQMSRNLTLTPVRRQSNHIAGQFTRLKQRKATNLDSRLSIELFYSQNFAPDGQ